MATRRVFVQACSLIALYPAHGRCAPQRLSETDPLAVAVGFVHDASKVDRAKYPGHAAGQRCSQCKSYRGKPAENSGGCVRFGGKLVAGAGWCSLFEA